MSRSRTAHTHTAFLVLWLLNLLFPITDALAGGAPPVVDPIPNQSITPDIADHGDSPKTLESKIQFTVQASDPESDPLFFSISSFTKNGGDTAVLQGITIDDATGEFLWPVRPHQVGSYTITFQVKDCRPTEEQQTCTGGSTSKTANVEVNLGQICDESGSACTFLNSHNSGPNKAAGHLGDFYLCGDYDSDLSYHSIMAVGGLPQLDFLDKLRQSDFTLNPGLNQRGHESRTFPGKIVIGNSSTAYTSGSYWGGHVRKDCMSGQSDINKAYAQYTGNTHMWYPEHEDHDAKDQHFTQIPYCSASQGSSGSEQDEMRKNIRTLAAFKAVVKDRLRTEGLIIPILQMIARRTRVATDQEYLSGLAHPNAFDNFSNQDAMMQMAYAINANDIPPLVEVEILDHSYDGLPGKDYFTSKSELYFESPASVSFVFRGKAYTRKIIASTRKSYDLNNRPLSYHWSVLRGSPSHVRITPLATDSSVVEIEIDYHPETTIENSTRLTNLVSIGAFVHNGTYYSPPAFVTSFSLHNEARSYSNGKIQEISYVEQYVDPNISSAKIAWDKDDFHYDGNNNLTGWTRHLSEGGTEDYNKDGHCTSCPKHSASGRMAFNDQALAGFVVRARHYAAQEGPYYVMTDSNGYFQFTQIREGTYYFEVENPPSQYYVSPRYTNVTSDQTNINPSIWCATGFQASGNSCLGQYTIGGQMTLHDQGIEEIKVTAQLSSGSKYSTTTAADGSYLLGVPQSGSYTLSAQRVGFVLNPQSWNNPISIGSSPAHFNANFAVGCETWNQDARCTDPSDRTPRAPSNLRIRP